jgi:hypothetical protein
VPTGLEHLRDAARLAAGRADERLHATALFALGGSLVHAVAAHAVEGTQALREAARLARRAGDHRLVAEALRDLAYVENASGRVEPTRRLLPAAAAAAGGDAGTLSSVRAIEGMFLADRGAHGRALRALRESAHLAESTGRTRQAAWSLSIASRSLLQQGELDGAAGYAEQCLQLAVEERWTAMLPWMEAVLADLDLANGRVGQAERRLRHTWSLGLDPRLDAGGHLPGHGRRPASAPRPTSACWQPWRPAPSSRSSPPARTCTGRRWARPLPGEQAVPSPGRVAAQPPRRRAVRWRTARVSSAAWASVSLAPQGERT